MPRIPKRAPLEVKKPTKKSVKHPKKKGAKRPKVKSQKSQLNWGLKSPNIRTNFPLGKSFLKKILSK